MIGPNFGPKYRHGSAPIPVADWRREGHSPIAKITAVAKDAPTLIAVHLNTEIEGERN